MKLSISALGANPLGFFLSLLLSFFLFQETLGSILPRSLAKRYVGTPSGANPKVPGGPATSDYPSDDDIRAAYTNPSGSSVFFSQCGDSSTPAFKFASANDGFIFRSAYPAKYTIRNKRSNTWYQDFADRFSGVMAEKASGNVYVVAPFNFVIDDCRVWSRIEFPTLKENTNVDTVTLVDYTDFSNTKVVWTKIELRSSEANAEIEKRSAALAQLQKRDTAFCLDWNGYGDDPNDPDSDVDGPATPYEPGSCGVHITQYQKNEGPGSDTSEYRYDIYVKDANGETLAESLTTEIADGATYDVDSALPYVFEVTSGSVDSDPISFAYAGQIWNSGDSQCSFGKYSGGNRNGDCGFTC